jgi:hypothetical protein
MGLIKKVDVEKYFADRRALRLGRTGFENQSSAAVIKPAGKAAKAARPATPAPGHSSASGSDPLIPSAAGLNEDPERKGDAKW